ncbi:DUF6454 family protein [Paracoccus alkanivorans]|uniref:Uncharacterized protein n=1 Tax=Paracoccus alkanivorans TaxID=2116655 RepID=A0A3M0M854_9RHOB|nr:DUF6454 family protein [Paracoccus alkanivorans]RMC33681.1 hypothetical protein C9E81_15330 [Paracoccus alkanivorans]
MRHIVIAIALCTPFSVAADELSDRVMSLTRGTEWQPVGATEVQFPTHHPQGMAIIGDHIFVSSVEIVTPTEKYDTPRDGMDRSAGEGVGHLFKMDMEGNLVDSITLADGDIYHPGGMDFDGEHLWVPVAEYRPDSASIVYRVDPETMEAEEVFRYPDHIGGILRDPASNTLHAVSWGSRRFYGFTLDEAGEVTNADIPREDLMVPNPSHYVDYQDCQLAAPGQALCTGIAKYQANGMEFALGGAELIDLKDNRPIHQAPVPLWTEDGLVMTHNPVWMAPVDGGLRAWFMPEDDESRIFVYEARLD